MTIKERLKKIWSSPSKYAVLYIFDIFIFTFLYAFYFDLDFKNASLSFPQAFYFSVVTVTTLGFGDLTPSLSATSLLITVSVQVVSGLLLIGLYLNAISHQLSDRKDEARDKVELEEADNKFVRILILLKPVVTEYLPILAETYKVTYPVESEVKKLRPKDLFGTSYYDQISRQNFYSMETRYGKDIMSWGDFIKKENDIFKSKIDDFLNKFTTALPIDLIEILNSLKGQYFLNFAEQAKTIEFHSKREGLSLPEFSFMIFEHSTMPKMEGAQYIRDFHNDLLSLIELIEEKTKCDPIEMTIHLQNGTAPPVGSAISSLPKYTI